MSPSDRKGNNMDTKMNLNGVKMIELNSGLVLINESIVDNDFIQEVENNYDYVLRLKNESEVIEILNAINISDETTLIDVIEFTEQR